MPSLLHGELYRLLSRILHRFIYTHHDVFSNEAKPLGFEFTHKELFRIRLLKPCATQVKFDLL
jgi:hypothetical protein